MYLNQEVRAVEDRFAQKTYSVGDGTKIAVDTPASPTQLKRVLRTMRRVVSNPNRVTFFDAGRRHPHIVFFDSSSRF